VDTTEQLADVLTKGLAQHQFEKLVARLMGLEAADEQRWLPSGHSSKNKSARMRGSVVGQAQLACRVAWLDPIDDGGMVRQSVANWTEAKVRTNMWDQYCTKGSFHSRGANCGQDRDHDRDRERGQNQGS